MLLQKMAQPKVSVYPKAHWLFNKYSLAANVDYTPIRLPISLTPTQTSVIMYVVLLGTSSANRNFYVNLEKQDPDDSNVTISAFGVTINITGTLKVLNLKLHVS